MDSAVFMTYLFIYIVCVFHYYICHILYSGIGQQCLVATVMLSGWVFISDDSFFPKWFLDIVLYWRIR